jgi:HK97 family phage major capsid protein
VTGGTIASWVKEGGAIPIAKATFDNAGLSPNKVAAITVATDAALEAAPGIEGQLFDDLTRAVVDTLDRDLLDPANSGTPGVTPPSITSAITPIPATSDPSDDLAALVAAFGGRSNRKRDPR